MEHKEEIHKVIFDKLPKNVVKDIARLSSDQKFFVWLYCPFNFIALDDIFKIYYLYDIPQNLVIKKIILNLHHREYDTQAIKNFLIESKYIDKSIINNDKQLIDLIIRSTQLKLHMLDSVTVKKLADFTKSIPKKIIKSHIGYPLPDPIHGRPTFGWGKCAYDGCNYGYRINKNFQGFLSGLELADHLRENNSLTYGLHLFHENIVSTYKLTPEKFLKSSGTLRCPSLVCNKADYNFSPEELIQHFRVLGIYPFWKVGDKITPEEAGAIKLEYNRFNKAALGNIFDENCCAVCLENESNIIFIPCFHQIVCWDCASMLKGDQQCPLCRKQIDMQLPF